MTTKRRENKSTNNDILRIFHGRINKNGSFICSKKQQWERQVEKLKQPKTMDRKREKTSVSAQVGGENETTKAWIFLNLQRALCFCFIVYKIKFSLRQMEPSAWPQQVVSHQNSANIWMMHEYIYRKQDKKYCPRDRVAAFGFVYVACVVLSRFNHQAKITIHS